MQLTMTTADWLRRAADAWSEADATTDPQVRHAKVLIAEGCERLAKHAAFLAEGDAYPSVSWFGELVRSVYLSTGLRVPAPAHGYGAEAADVETCDSRCAMTGCSSAELLLGAPP